MLPWKTMHIVCQKVKSHAVFAILERKRNLMFSFLKCYFSELKQRSHHESRRMHKHKGGEYCVPQKIARVCSSNNRKGLPVFYYILWLSSQCWRSPARTGWQPPENSSSRWLFAFTCNTFPIQLFQDAFQSKYSPKPAIYKELLLNKYSLRTSTNL